jgi:DNA invertase Pin-like site-specific DNA recombinase
MRAALYERVSTEEQKMHGLSLEAQKEALEAYAKERSMLIVGHYTDAGVSGQKPISKRPALQRLLADVQAGKVDIVLFTKLDRWSRKVKEYYKAQDVLDKRKVPWRAILEDYETETPSGEFKVNIMLSVNQNEAQRATERIKAVFDAKRARGEVCSGSVPPGIAITADKHLEAAEPGASMMRDIFREFIAVRSIYAAQRYMAQKYNVLRDTTTFRKLLCNKKYRGLVIDAEVFDVAQEILNTRAQRNAQTGRVYLFSGLLVCGCCGYRMNAYVCKDYYYYRCARRLSVGDCNFASHIREEKVERYLLDHFLIRVEEYNAELYARRQAPIDTAAIKRKMDKLTDIYIADLISREKYEREYRELQAALSAASRVDERPIDVAQARAVLELYNQLDKPGKKEFWSRTIKSITVHPDSSFSFTLRQL